MVKLLRSSRQTGRPGLWHGVVPEALVPSERDRFTGRVGIDRYDSDRKNRRRDERDSQHELQPTRNRPHGRPRRPMLRRPPVIVASVLVTSLAMGGTAVAAVRHQHQDNRDVTTAAAPALVTAAGGAATPRPTPGAATATSTPGAVTTPAVSAGLTDRRLYRGTVDAVLTAAQGGKSAKQNFESSVLVTCQHGSSCAIVESPNLYPDVKIDLKNGVGTYTSTKHYTQAQICASRGKWIVGYHAEATLTETSMTYTYVSEGYYYHCSWGSIGASTIDATFTGDLSPS